jgi:hypothetical protein
MSPMGPSESAKTGPTEKKAGSPQKRGPGLDSGRFPIGVSWIAHLIAAGATLIYFCVAPTLALLLLSRFVGGEGIDPVAPLFLPFFSLLTLTLAAAVALGLTILAIAIDLWFQRRGDWNGSPLLWVFPVVALLIVPEGLSRGGSTAAWVSVAFLVALGFCLHWIVFRIAETHLD